MHSIRIDDPDCFQHSIANPIDVVVLRKHVLDRAREMGFDSAGSTKLATAVSELARNALEHGGGGEAACCPCTEPGRSGLRVVIEDEGPGIPDVLKAMSDGYTTGGGMGLGLPGAKRLVDDMKLISLPGRGTRVEIVKWTRM